MKKLLTIFVVAISVTAFGQSAQDYLQSGIDKHKNQDYKGAISDYSKAIKADKDNRDAYFNRGTCELALKDFKSAMNDFNKTIEIDPKFAKAYYSRATVYVSQEKYADALPDLDKTIELDPAIPNALTLRGQIRSQTGDNKGACEDFNKAKENGDKQADKYIQQLCVYDQRPGESLMLDWPDSEGWTVASNQANNEMKLIELLRNEETFENWTEIGTMTVFPLKEAPVNIPIDVAMNVTYEQAKKNAPKAKLTFIEKDENAEYPWIIFTIEAPGFKNDKTPESQLYYIVQGKQALYSNFRAIKQATIPPDLIEKWTKFFKTGKIVNQ